MTFHGFCSAPAEIIGMIADYCHYDDLMTLRLTCREVCAKMDDVFLTMLFTERVHLYTYYSLSKLNRICARPALVRKLRRVEIVFWKLNMMLYDLREERPDAFSRERFLWNHVEYRRYAFGRAKAEEQRLACDDLVLRCWRESFGSSR